MDFGGAFALLRMYEKLKAAFDEKSALLQRYEEQILQARELVTPVVDEQYGSTGYLEIVTSLEACYEEHVERLYYLFKQYQLTHFLSKESVETGESVIDSLRRDYTEKLQALYDKHKIESGPTAEEIVETQLESGVDMDAWFDLFQRNFDQKVQRDEHSVSLRLDDYDMPRAISEVRQRASSKMTRFSSVVSLESDAPYLHHLDTMSGSSLPDIPMTTIR